MWFMIDVFAVTVNHLVEKSEYDLCQFIFVASASFTICVIYEN